jgi:uncharacterized protein with WD repeat
MAKAKQTTRKTIPGAVFVEEVEKASKSANKKTVDRADVSHLAGKLSEIKVSSKITAEQMEEDAKQKKIRKLKKVLREIEQIEEKLRDKQAVEKEQMEKLKKKESILSELEELGAELND